MNAQQVHSSSMSISYQAFVRHGRTQTALLGGDLAIGLYIDVFIGRQTVDLVVWELSTAKD